MEFIGWNTILFISKWVFIGLIYLVLFIVLIAVRREMSLRLHPGQSSIVPDPGKLQVLTSGGDRHLASGTILPLQPQTCLGADRDNDIVLGDRYISGRHACLRWDGASWWLEDLGSRNGTFVGQQRCQPHEPRAVTSGATIKMGDMSFKLLT